MLAEDARATRKDAATRMMTIILSEPEEGLEGPSPAAGGLSGILPIAIFSCGNQLYQRSVCGNRSPVPSVAGVPVADAERRRSPMYTVPVVLEV